MTEVWPARAIFGPSTEIESSSYNPINLLSFKISAENEFFYAANRTHIWQAQFSGLSLGT